MAMEMDKGLGHDCSICSLPLLLPANSTFSPAPPWENLPIFFEILASPPCHFPLGFHLHG
ncbi:MAG: hypothetical protein EBT57_04325 [Verrucomicrobia bacterium]|nr:hypothetical protein [Verrucomicrobiota bacterium]